MQQGFTGWVDNGKGSAVLIAVAGSGKTTTIKRCLLFIPEQRSVLVLAFNAGNAKEMREGIAELGAEVGRLFANVSAKTFHSLGFGAVCKRLGKGAREIQTDGKKLRRLFKAGFPQHIFAAYKDFVPALVSLAKGEGVGCLVPDTEETWFSIIDHHALTLDSEDTSFEEAVKLAQTLLSDSNLAAQKGDIDFDDQIYLPVLWRLSLWGNDWVFIDEAQDTNPVRRALAKKALRPGGRLVAVGDPNQGIYGFTGASTDAIELIKKEFNAIELPLTISYRCPKAAEALVQPLVPHFSVHESAPEGSVLHMVEGEGIARLSDHDAVLCRNTSPLVELAFSLIAKGRGCVVLGKDIGAGLIALVEQLGGRGIDGMLSKLDAYLDREITNFLAKGEEEKAERLTDKAACLRTVAEHLPEKTRTLPGLVAKIESLFSDSNGVLTLCTAHKAKGKEWDRVAILRPDLMPSKWARQEWQYQQEINLQYVSWTRFKDELIFLDGEVAEAAEDENQKEL